MRYDLELILKLCKELGFPSHRKNERVEIALGQGAVLVFENAEQDKDCLVAFSGTSWHAHDDLMFTDGCGNYVELNYLDIVAGLKDGQILVCEQWQRGAVIDRWLIHRDYNDEFKYMEEGEELRVRRPTSG